MAESDVNISAFLELKDNISPGIKKAADELDKMGTSATEARAAVSAMSASHSTAASSVVSGTSAMAAGFDRARDASGRFVTGAKAAGAAAKEAGGAAKESGEAFYTAFLKATLTADAIKAAATKAFELGKSFVNTGVELNKTFQEMELRIAGSLKAFDLSPTMDAAVKDSHKAISTIRDMAAKLPGESSEYLQVFVQGLPKLAEAGMTDITKMAKFVSQYTAALYGSVDAAQAANDLFMMLSGTAGMDVKTFQVLNAHINMTTEAFNKLPIEERLSTINEAIAQQAQALGLASQMYASVYGEYQSLIDEILQVSSAQMTADIAGNYATINEFLALHKQDLIDVVSLIYDGIGVGLKIATGFLNGFAYIALAIKKTIEGIASMIGYVGRMIQQVVFDTDTLVTRLDDATESQRRLNDEKAAGFAEERQHQRQMNALVEDYKKQMDAVDKQRMEAQQIKEKPWFSDVKKALGMKETQFQIGSKGKEYVGQLQKMVKEGRIDRSQAMSFLETMGGQKDVMEDMWRRTEGGRDRGRGGGRGGGRAGRAPRRPRDTTPRVVQDFRYSKFNITQEFAEGFDPDRIAVAFASDLGRLGEMKTQAAYSPTFAI